MIKLIVGLGNPGQQYEHTRHNVGVWYINALSAANSLTLKSESKLHARIAPLFAEQHKCLLAVPTTFMNLSGQTVQALMAYYKIKPNEILVAHDELDLDVGVIKFKLAGGHGGHNGLRDIIQKIGKDFWRLRIGIGHPGHKDKVTSYVLGRVDQASESLIQDAITQTMTYTNRIMQSDFAWIMNQIH